MSKAEHVAGDRYRVRVLVGDRQRARYFRAKSQREANKLAASHEATLRAEAEQAKSEVGTVKQAVDRWVKHRAAKDSPATIYRRASIVNAIRRDLGRYRLAELTAFHIDQWYDVLRAEDISHNSTPRFRSESTIHHYHRVLHAILRQAYLWDMTDRTPADKVGAPKRRRHARIVSPPPATVTLLINAAGPDLALAARVLAATGLRRGELCALRWPDVDLDAGTIRVTRSLVALPGKAALEKVPKTDESIRLVHLDPATIAVLDRHHRRQHSVMTELAGDAYLLANPLSADRTGRTPRSPDWISRAWRRLCEEHGAKIRLHDLRHMHATQLIDAGIPITAVSARLGHAKTSTTSDIYGHPVIDSDRAAAVAIAGALSAGPPP